MQNRYAVKLRFDDNMYNLRVHFAINNEQENN